MVFTKLPYYANAKNLSSVIQKVAKPHLQKGGYAFATLILDWEKIVGTKIAILTKPKKLTFPKGQGNPGLLQLQVEPGAALMIGFQKGIILEKIRTFYGKQLVFDITFDQKSLSKAKSVTLKPIEKKNVVSLELRENLNAIEDNDLKEALLSLSLYIN
ncbi:MAG: DUF721 domain-containing protein [Proteobacteria bacterium]|nr:DUF721 domain-containing protein [Pseudomonadota bacterium]